MVNRFNLLGCLPPSPKGELFDWFKASPLASEELFFFGGGHPLKGSNLTCLICSMIDHKSHFIQTYHKSNIVHHNSKITNHKSNIIHHRSQIIDHRSQIKIHKSNITHQKSQITNSPYRGTSIVLKIFSINSSAVMPSISFSGVNIMR